MEKNEAKSKVEQLGEENRVLMEKLEYFKNSTNTSEAFSQHGEASSSGLIDEYKMKIQDLEKITRSSEEAHEKCCMSNAED
uniref:Uncharacterized protein n=1 Tax=Ditylenchus dipsaci TaxID=166011 RepID=A0A915D3B4_9BILA